MTPEQQREVWENHNGYVLEQLFSPLVVLSSSAHEELIELGRGCVTKPTVRHYQGFARGRRKRLAEPDPTVNHLLYAYRVLLTGIHLMETGEVVANIQVLNERFRLAEIDELVARKRAGAEKMALDERDMDEHGGLLDRLEAKPKRHTTRASSPTNQPRWPRCRTSWSAFVWMLRQRSEPDVPARAAHHLPHPCG